MDLIEVDADQISEVAAFYRRASLVVEAVSHDLAAHHFGAWARTGGTDSGDAGDRPGNPDTMSALAARYARMSAALADRLRMQSEAADELARALSTSTTALTAGDAAAAMMVRR